ncbi:MAG: hypothetical protein HFH68_00255 [Lachnospiraceae bacterium]|nr:hypothetical protein [Lachnospiraceae bacterium]
MCGNCYEKFVKRSGKTMLLCKLRASESTDETGQLCCFQHYCPDKEKYVANDSQNKDCKFYK